MRNKEKRSQRKYSSNDEIIIRSENPPRGVTSSKESKNIDWEDDNEEIEEFDEVRKH
jgi:hypothetical protein